MIKKIKDLITKISNKEEIEESSNIVQLDRACAALLVEIAFADKDFDEREKESLKQSLLKSYAIDIETINELSLIHI